jgi:SET domain-containing protein
MVTYKKSFCEGSGLIADKDIEPNTFVFITHARHPKLRMWVNITPNCLYNHSKEKENCKIVTVKNAKNLHTIKEVEKGQELFVDYTKDMDLEQPKENWYL